MNYRPAIATGLCLVMMILPADGQSDTMSRTGLLTPKKIVNHFRHEISLISENDNYALQLRDGYYTNGLAFRFTRVAPSKKQDAEGSKTPKVIESFEAGQMIFNPVRYDSIRPATQDRPFSGYLYGRYEQTRFPSPGSMLKWSITLGTIGPRSMAANVQRWYHGIIGIYDVKGWNTQLNNEWNVNARLEYSASLLKGLPQHRKWDLSPTGQLQLGNAITDATAGLLFRAGTMENYAQSAHWNGRVSSRADQAPVHDKEFYFFVQPAVVLQAWNAPLQGGLFLKDRGPKTADIRPFYWFACIGFKLSQNRWTLGMHYLKRSRQVFNQLRDEKFISIQLAYRTGMYAKPVKWLTESGK